MMAQDIQSFLSAVKSTDNAISQLPVYAFVAFNGNSDADGGYVGPFPQSFKWTGELGGKPVTALLFMI